MIEKIKADNQRLAAILRRMAEKLEQSEEAHHWHASASGGAPVFVGWQHSYDGPNEREIVGHTTVRKALFIGDEGFVNRMKAHLDKEL